MSFDLHFWRYAKGRRPHPAVTSARLDADIATPELAELDPDELERAVRAQFPGFDAEEGDHARFVCEIDHSSAEVALAGALRQTDFDRLIEFAENQGLHVFSRADPVPPRVASRIERELDEHGSLSSVPEDPSEIRAQAEAGNAAAQFQLGNAHSGGDGAPQDDAAAFMWFRRSADAGNVDGMFNLAWCYRNGRGVIRDVTAAVQWLERAMQFEECDAPFVLAEIYEAGDGVPADPDRARELFRVAWENGHPRARKRYRALGGA